MPRPGPTVGRDYKEEYTRTRERARIKFKSHQGHGSAFSSSFHTRSIPLDPYVRHPDGLTMEEFIKKHLDELTPSFSLLKATIGRLESHIAQLEKFRF